MKNKEANKKEEIDIFYALKIEWKYLYNRKLLFLLYIFMFIIAGIVTLITPYWIGTIFNSIQEKITTDSELHSLLWKISFLLVLTIVFWSIHGLARVLEQITGFYVRKNYLNDLVKQILALPVKWQKDNHSGDTIAKINRASSALEEFSSNTTFDIVYGFVNLIGSIIILFFIDWKIAAFVLFFSSIVLFIISRFDKILIKKYREINEYNNKYSASLFDYISNIITVITLRLKKVVSREIDNKQMIASDDYKQSARINESKWAFASIAIQIMIILVLIYHSYNEYNISGTILIGTLYMLYGYLSNVGSTFYRFASLYSRLIRINTNIKSINNIEEEYEKVKVIKKGNLPLNWKEITLKKVSFTYNQKGEINHIDNIDFSFKRKQKIALVGESGSGKSTILSLIRGLYELENGSVYCDGKILVGGLNTIMDEITLIPQEPEIFNNTFKYNITLNLPVSNNEIKKAIEMAQLKIVLSKLPKGLNTSVLEKGVSLSGGEKQRLALARGLLAAKDSNILLLDEPTSSVDSLNELKIHDAIFKEFKSKTIISSIHRLHLLDKFDYIYVFSKGKLVGEGTFEEIKKNPHFFTMWRKYNKEKSQDKELVRKDKNN